MHLICIFSLNYLLDEELIINLLVMLQTVSEYAIKHSTARWVTLRKVEVRLIEQHENLKEYFLIFFSKDSSFSRCKRNSKIWTKWKDFERRRYRSSPSILCDKLWNDLASNVPIIIHIIYRNAKPSVDLYEQIYQIKKFV